jgi:hypothetical protein
LITHQNTRAPLWTLASDRIRHHFERITDHHVGGKGRAGRLRVGYCHDQVDILTLGVAED